MNYYPTTPRPWAARVHRAPNGANYYRIYEGEDSEERQALAQVVSGRDTDGYTARNNAELIVRAVNSFDSLVAALKVLTLTPSILVHLELHDPQALAQARAALRLAEGKW